MYAEVEVGGKTIPMLANGATPLRYKKVFNEDLLQKIDYTDGSISLAMNGVNELAFIMAKAAEGADMNTLNEDMFIEWLEQFDSMDIISAGQDIMNCYIGNMATSSKAKKKASASRNAK